MISYTLLGFGLVIFAWMLFKWIKNFKESRRLRNNIPDNTPLSVRFPMTQEDLRYLDLIKRIDAMFVQQKESIQGRALKAHDQKCEDPLTCTKFPCFVPSPDIIVSKTKVRLKTKVQRTTTRLKELGL